MAIDFKLIQDGKGWDLDIENGDFAKTDSLDTAVYMSVFCEKRAEQISEPSLRRGHFTNQFNKVAGYQVGSLLWLYTDQAKQTTSNLSLIEGAVSNGLQWLIDDKIISQVKVKAEAKNGEVSIGVDLINKLQANNKYYNLFVNL